MNLYELIAKYGKGKGEQTMWRTVRTISDYIEDKEDALDGAEELYKKIYEDLCGKHFNREFAKKTINEMYYKDGQGAIKKAPYWTEDMMHEVYGTIKNLIPGDYTEHDVWVAMNMLRSDYGLLMENWFPGEVDRRVVEMTVSYFNDPDAKEKDGKIWHYMMG